MGPFEKVLAAAPSRLRFAVSGGVLFQAVFAAGGAYANNPTGAKVVDGGCDEG
jgi:hypothetical protein